MIKPRWPSSLWGQASVVAGLLIVVLLIATFPYHQKAQKPTQNNDAQRAAQRQEAVDKAQEYLITNFDKIESQQLLILDYLYRNFGLNPKFGAANIPLNAHITDEDTAKEFESVIRIAYPDKIVSDLGPSPSLIARAANCDHISLPSNTEGTIRENIESGRYQLTHVALSLQIMHELSCSFPNIDSLRVQASDGLVQLAKNDQTVADLRYEAIALLGFMGQRNLVEPQWIDQIVTDQQPDGKWLSGSSTKPDHSTVLALWAVLAYTNNAKNEPIIRH